MQMAGALNGRSRLGWVTRSIKTSIDTTANANSVPMLTNSPTRSIGKSAARTATTKPVVIVETYCVRKRGWFLAATGGSKPSCAPENSWLPEQRDQNDRGQAEDDSQLYQGGEPADAGCIDADRNRIRNI
jgi:hypothetical protein